MRGFAGMVLGLTALAGAASAAEMKLESAAPTPAETVRGDFDGDGRLDDVWFAPDEDDRQGIYVRLNRAHGREDIKVISLDARLAAQVQRAPVAEYRYDCGAFADHCGDGLKTTTDGLILTLDEGITVLVHWNGQAFDQDFVQSDDVRLSRAVAALAALNL